MESLTLPLGRRLRRFDRKDANRQVANYSPFTCIGAKQEVGLPRGPEDRLCSSAKFRPQNWLRAGIGSYGSLPDADIQHLAISIQLLGSVKTRVSKRPTFPRNARAGLVEGVTALTSAGSAREE